MDLLTRLRSALADRYRIERELGRGGMATVYLAEDLKHDRPGRAEGAPPGADPHPGRRAVPSRDPHRLRPATPAHPQHSRLRRGTGRPLLRDAVRRGRVAPGAARPRSAAHGGRGRPHRRRGGGGPGLRPCSRSSAPGHQAGEHPPHLGTRAGRRFRHCPGHRRRGQRAPHRDRAGSWHAALHEPRAGLGQPGAGRPQRPIRPRVRAVRDARRGAALQRAVRTGHHGAPRGRSGAAPPDHPVHDQSRARSGGRQSPGEGAGRPIRHRPGVQGGVGSRQPGARGRPTEVVSPAAGDRAGGGGPRWWSGGRSAGWPGRLAFRCRQRRGLDPFAGGTVVREPHGRLGSGLPGERNHRSARDRAGPDRLPSRRRTRRSPWGDRRGRSRERAGPGGGALRLAAAVRERHPNQRSTQINGDRAGALGPELRRGAHDHSPAPGGRRSSRGGAHQGVAHPRRALQDRGEPAPGLAGGVRVLCARGVLSGQGDRSELSRSPSATSRKPSTPIRPSPRPMPVWRNPMPISATSAAWLPRSPSPSQGGGEQGAGAGFHPGECAPCHGVSTVARRVELRRGGSGVCARGRARFHQRPVALDARHVLDGDESERRGDRLGRAGPAARPVVAHNPVRIRALVLQRPPVPGGDRPGQGRPGPGFHACPGPVLDRDGGGAAREIGRGDPGAESDHPARGSDLRLPRRPRSRLRHQWPDGARRSASWTISRLDPRRATSRRWISRRSGWVWATRIPPSHC